MSPISGASCILKLSIRSSTAILLVSVLGWILGGANLASVGVLPGMACICLLPMSTDDSGRAQAVEGRRFLLGWPSPLLIITYF